MNFNLRLLLSCVLLATQAGAAQAQIQAPAQIAKAADLLEGNTFSGVQTTQYANGSPQLWRELLHGKANGLWLEWYPDGTLRYRAYWKEDLGNGKWEYFHPNGQLRSESFYINDIAQGIYKSYFENGHLQAAATYLNGNKHGPEYIYDSNGVLLNRFLYDDGRLLLDQPIPFEPAKITSTKNNEWGICFTPDGHTAYFTRKDDATKSKRIYETQKTANGWSEPRVAAFSTAEDEAPFINQQGTKLFFASFRPLPDSSTTQSADMNIWYMDMTASGWSEPQPILGPINQSMQSDKDWPSNYEAGPVTDEAGNLYYWTKGSKNNGTNLYFAARQANGSFGEPYELIEPSSHQHFDSAPQLSPDGNLLFFASDGRSVCYGGTDIYYAKKVEGAWTAAKNLGPTVNSSGYDSFPSFSPDGRYFFFSSTRAGRKDANGEDLADIYYMEAKFLNIE